MKTKLVIKYTLNDKARKEAFLLGIDATSKQKMEVEIDVEKSYVEVDTNGKPFLGSKINYCIYSSVGKNYESITTDCDIYINNLPEDAKLSLRDWLNEYFDNVGEFDTCNVTEQMILNRLDVMELNTDHEKWTYILDYLQRKQEEKKEENKKIKADERIKKLLSLKEEIYTRTENGEYERV